MSIALFLPLQGGGSRWGFDNRMARSPSFDHSPAQTARSRDLKRNMTGYEKRLWLRLRNGQLGVSFRRQHPVGPYFLDFAAPSAMLAIELDGLQHGFDADAERDRARTAFLETRGWRVLRFWNSNLIENFEGVLETIWREVGSQ